MRPGPGRKVLSMSDPANETALLLAAFGAARPQALKGLSHVLDKVKARFPDHEVRLGFTSRFMQRIWRKRRRDSAWQREHSDVGIEILNARGVLAGLAELQEEGFRHIILQSLHIYAGEEYETLKSMTRALLNIQTVKARHKPFRTLRLGRPALGEPGDIHPYRDDLARAAHALAVDAEAAAGQGAALVYMGHGNRYFSSGAYMEFQAAMRRAYPQVRTMVGVIEGFPDLGRVVEELDRNGVKKVILAPLLLVAGGHVLDDMAGNGEDSWKTAMIRRGIEVDCLVRGLGELDAWVEIYIENIRELLPETEAVDLAGTD